MGTISVETELLKEWVATSSFFVSAYLNTLQCNTLETQQSNRHYLLLNTQYSSGEIAFQDWIFWRRSTNFVTSLTKIYSFNVKCFLTRNNLMMMNYHQWRQNLLVSTSITTMKYSMLYINGYVSFTIIYHIQRILTPFWTDFLINPKWGFSSLVSLFPVILLCKISDSSLLMPSNAIITLTFSARNLGVIFDSTLYVRSHFFSF